MQFLDRIDAIEVRAGQVRLSLWELCRRADLDYSRISRWRAGDNSPIERTLDRYVDGLTREVEKVEAELRAHLLANSNLAKAGGRRDTRPAA